MVLFLLFAAFGWLFGLIGGVRDRETGAPDAVAEEDLFANLNDPSAPETAATQGDGTVLWQLSSGGTAMYTIEVGDAATGPLTVVEDATATGTYAWSGTTLTLAFARTLTMEDGYTFEDPWSFTCTGSPTAAELPCIGTSNRWFYSPVNGLDRGPSESFDVTATRR
ncbi:MAG: hypothetical protein GC156_03840 [Actinomycetales bacterium]|nr:hypothetical protein [Actinomycetales bacterium]